DTKFYLALIRSVIRHGWYDAGHSLGAPFGQNLSDFPQGGDDLSFVLIRVLALFTSNPALVDNLFYLATFPLIAASAYLVAVRLGVSRGPATLVAVLFALLPYHFYRNESQLLLSAYYSVPLSCYLFLTGVQGTPLLTRRAGGRLPWLSRRTLATLGLCAVIGSADFYYGAFALVLLAAGALTALIARRGRAAAAGLAACAVLIGACLCANLAPSLLYRAEHGNNALLERSLSDTELLGLKPAQLLLPVRDHRLKPLANLNRNFAAKQGVGYCEQCYETLGTGGDIGFLWLLGGAIAAVLGGGALLSRRRLYGPLALGVLLSLLIASVGGLSDLTAYFITPDIRGWNRMSLFIAFFSLLALALLLEAGRRALARRGVRARWWAVMLGALVVLGVLDETSTDFIPNYSGAAIQWRSDSSFFGTVQRTLGAGASVFELPYVPFPEGYGAATSAQGFASPTYGTTYEEARGYITSTSLNWSYGAMKGRPADWEAALAAKPLAVAVAAATLSGFQGLVIEPSGYGVPRRELMAALRSQLRQAPVVSQLRDVWFFDLRPYAARLRRRLSPVEQQQVRAATLHPLKVSCGSSALTLNGGSATNPVTATFSAQLTGLLGPLLARFPDGSVQTVRPVDGAATISHPVRLARPSGPLQFFATTPVPAGYDVQVAAATLTPQAYQPLTPPLASSIQAGYPAPTCQLQPGLSPQAP
ncbi:MAG TPA: hypothetical protein VHX88_09810, partial [Solirubrobacteraceae bacterium]|nr:hypothetical protein [Solirubrobacteraceae bacterium]